MRNIQIAVGEHYHIFNRGVNKQTIFHDNNDYSRFLFLLLYFQAKIGFKNINRLIKDFVQHSVLHTHDEVVEKRIVEVVVFCVMPNHFHVILKEVEEGGIPMYLQRVLNAYGKYYNTKYEKTGHVFQGPYRAVHILDDTQLLHLSAYIHRNPRELARWFRREDQYPWSSYQDFLGESRWGKLVAPEIILGQFKHKSYKKFVESSLAKVSKEELASLGF